MKSVLLTGDRPTGPLHLGHYVGSLQNRVLLQNQYQSYIMVADWQALTDYYDRPEHITSNVLEVVKDYLSIGIDPSCATIFIQSQIPQLAELSLLFLNLVTIARLERNPTVKTEIQQKGMDHSIPAGFFCYPVSQAADIALFQTQYVPVGDDQLPMLEQTNEIIRKFHRLYGEGVFQECEPILSQHSGRLVGIDGKAKASKSLGNAIFLSDSPEIIRQKVFQMYTDPNHIQVSDPGQVEGNVVFSYLDIFHENKQEVEELKAQYRQGGLGDMVLKRLLNQKIQDFLAPIAAKRQALHNDDVQQVLFEGTQKALKAAEQTMQKVRKAIGLEYFSRLGV